MKDIAYIELDCHAEVVNNFMTLMECSKKFRVDYFLSSDVMKQLAVSSLHNIFPADKKNICHQLKKTYALVIIGTAGKDFRLYKKIAKNQRCYVIAHNINFTKASSAQILKNAFKQNFLFFISLLKSGILFKDSFERSVKHLVLDTALIHCNQDIALELLPLSFNKYTLEGSGSAIRVAIPGSVDFRRRDYKRVFNTIIHFKNDVTVILVGKASGEALDIVLKMQAKLPTCVKLIYYKHTLSEKEYEDNLKNAHVLWSPLQTATCFMGIKEYYGKTKVTGNKNDAIKYGKPLIMPFSSNIQEDFIFIESSRLEQQFVQLSQLRLNFSEYMPEKIRIQLEDKLQDLIN